MQFYLAFLAVITGVRHIGKREDPGNEVGHFLLLPHDHVSLSCSRRFRVYQLCVNLFSDNLTIFKPFEIRYCSVMT